MPEPKLQSEAINSAELPAKKGRLALYGELTKIRLSLLVLVTTAVGFLLGLPEGVNWLQSVKSILVRVTESDWSGIGVVLQTAFGAIDWLTFAIVLTGTLIAAAGTSAINQWMEIDRDREMPRTKDRPLPSGHMGRSEAFLAGVVFVMVGGGSLFFFVNPLAGFLTFLTAALYIFLYTPLKPRSTFNTLVGAVCGAIPPMIGWAAAAGELSIGAWLLGGILFIWQLPHFFALAWMYQDDYARGGFKMLPSIDPDGELTSRLIVLTSLLLIPLGLMMTLFGVNGLLFAVISLVLGLLFAVAGFKMYLDRSRSNARRVFLMSILYLPLIMTAMVIDQARPPVEVLATQNRLRAAEEVQQGKSEASDTLQHVAEAR